VGYVHSVERSESRLGRAALRDSWSVPSSSQGHESAPHRNPKVSESLWNALLRRGGPARGVVGGSRLDDKDACVPRLVRQDWRDVGLAGPLELVSSSAAAPTRASFGRRYSVDRSIKSKSRHHAGPAECPAGEPSRQQKPPTARESHGWKPDAFLCYVPV